MQTLNELRDEMNCARIAYRQARERLADMNRAKIRASWTMGELNRARGRLQRAMKAVRVRLYG